VATSVRERLLASRVDARESWAARRATLDRLGKGARVLLAPISAFLERMNPVEERVPYVAGRTRLWAELARPAILGFIASGAIVAGASQQNSPFTVKLIGAWYFGIPPYNPVTPPFSQQGLFLGVVAVFGGMLLLLRAFYDVARVVSRHPGTPVRLLVPVFIAWVAPLLIVAPLFSRDAYSYAAQGELMSRGINPYQYDPQFLNGTAFMELTDKLWRNVPSPYGPLFLIIDGWIVALTGHNFLMSVEALRILALAGTAMFAAAVPVIARSFGRDGGTAFALAALNPLVLLHLIGGEHNDALMLGLLAVGYALARRGHPVVGIVCCALAASVKAPAFLGVIYIGWEWLGPGRTARERLRPVATAVALGAAVMAVLSAVSGIGWGWVSGLSNPDTVRSWLDPATGFALVVSRVVQAIGLGSHLHLVITLARGSGLLAAGLVALYLLANSERIGPLSAMGWTFLALVLLSPVVQPWYLAWGFVFLAPVAEGAIRRILIFGSGCACFVQVPGGSALLTEIGEANPWIVAFASAALVALALLLVLPRVRRGDRGSTAGEAGSATRHEGARELKSIDA
jgi:hypothetical protein